ncbi:MAG: hypothetical protein RI897_4281 [Verrucomicrobiota bacterium]
MRRLLVIGVLGFCLAGASYGFLVGRRTTALARVEASCGPELAWMQREFGLDGADFERVRELHEAYKPVCAGYCAQIDEQYLELERLLESGTGVTEEMERVIAEANRLRSLCQTAMLEHFFQVSRAMSPEQGKRYLAWMHEQTLAPSHSSMVPRSGPAGAGHEHEHHVH